MQDEIFMRLWDGGHERFSRGLERSPAAPPVRMPQRPREHLTHAALVGSIILIVQAAAAPSAPLVTYYAAA